MKTPTVEEMRAMFRVHTEAAVKVIVEIMTTGTGAKGEAVRLAAANEILNRGWGRPPSHKDMYKDAPQPDGRPEWRTTDGKTFAQAYAEEEAKVAARAAAASESPAPSKSGPAAVSAAAAAPGSPTGPVREVDPTGYIARRAMWSGGSPSPSRGRT